jgi:hypothetical protein
VFDDPAIMRPSGAGFARAVPLDEPLGDPGKHALCRRTPGPPAVKTEPSFVADVAKLWGGTL